jgi:hypothetical protein
MAIRNRINPTNAKRETIELMPRIAKFNIEEGLTNSTTDNTMLTMPTNIR